jgi:hypothetical protein
LIFARDKQSFHGSGIMETDQQAEKTEKQEQPAVEKPDSAAPAGQSRGRHGRRRPRHRDGNRGRDRREHGEESRGDQHRSGGETRPGSAHGTTIRGAMQQVEHIRVELKRVLEEIYQVLQTLEQVEREKSASEEEIEMLRESLRLLHREHGQGRNPRGPRPGQAASTTPSQTQSEPDEEEGED